MKDFVPAAHYPFLTRFYDGFSRLFFSRIFKKIATLINPKPGEKILDLGCGPGNLIVELKKLQPAARLTGLDVDPEILAIAQKKFEKFQFAIPLIEASATDIHTEEEFDSVVSSLMIHHLSLSEKKEMLAGVYRILKPGGKFYLYDFGPPKNRFGKFLSFIYRWFEEIDDGVQGRYVLFIKEARFKEVKSVFKSNVFELLEARK